MSQQDKAALWRELKDAGVQFPLHYREYTTEQLGAAVAKLRAGQEVATENHTAAPAEHIAPVTPIPQPKIAPPDTL